MIAWNLAQRFPESLHSLSLLSAPPPSLLARLLFNNLDQLWRNWYLLALRVPAVPEWLLQQNLTRFLKDWFQIQAIRKAPFSSETLGICQSALLKTGVLSSALNYYRTWLAPQSWLARFQEPLAPVQVPTLVLWGQDDAILNPALMKGFDRFIANPFRTRLIPDCGHWIQQEAPQLVNLELLSFLRYGGLQQPTLGSLGHSCKRRTQDLI